MPVIEGVGDEVFQVLMIFLIVVLGIVGWWSTSISEQPLIRTVLILEPRHHTPVENSTNVITPNPPQDTGQPDSTSTNDVHPETVAVPDTSSSASKNQTHGSPEQQPQTTDGADAASSSSQNAESEGSIHTQEDDSNETLTDTPNTSVTSDVCPDVLASAVRRRRIQFFQDRQGDENVTNTCSKQHETPEERSHDVAEASSSTSCNHEPVEQEESQADSEQSSSDPCLACDDIRIKLKFLNDNQKLVQGKLQEPLGDFKRRNFAVEIAARKVIRLIFNGQVLQSDERTLQNYGLFDNCVVHCLVHNQRTTNPNVENATNGNTGDELHFGGTGIDVGETREWDMSNVMYISMFVILSAIWYLRINFSQLFSATSTVALFGLSGIFVIFLVGMYIPDQEAIRT